MKLKQRLRVSFLVIMIFFNFNLLIALENEIQFKINNEIITTLDINNEINYLKVINPQIINLDKGKLIEVAKNSIIRDKAKQIHLLNFFEELKVKNEYLKEVIKSKYKKMGFNDKTEYINFLSTNNLTIDYIHQKITIEALWNEIIFKKFRSKIKIDKDKIRNEILNNPDKEFLFSEIVFNVQNKNQFEAKYNQIKDDINLNGFKSAAIIHSISDSSTSGGDIGWININSLNESIKKEIKNKKIGEYTKPIVTASGFLIIKVEDIRKKNLKDNDIDNIIKSTIKLKINQQLNQSSNIYYNRILKDFDINEL